MAVDSPPQKLTIEEYLASSFEHEPDYVDGFLVERPVGGFDHGAFQAILSELFRRHLVDWNIRVSVEQHVRVAPMRVRVADVAVLRRDLPKEQIITRPPLICIEVLSPDDSHADLADRVEDYLAMGVENVWVVDPRRREGFVCSTKGWNTLTAGRFEVAGTPIYLALDELFAALDEA